MARAISALDRLALRLLKSSPKLTPATKQVLRPALVGAIEEAEATRMSWIERYVWDGGGKGPGQMYEPAFVEVKRKLGAELEAYLVGSLAEGGSGAAPATRAALRFPDAVTTSSLAPFFIAGYLALMVDQAQKPGRSPEDALAFGIGRYYGAYASLKEAQDALASQAPGGKPPLAYEPVRSHIEAKGTAKQQSAVAYVAEVLQAWRTSPV